MVRVISICSIDAKTSPIVAQKLAIFDSVDKIAIPCTPIYLPHFVNTKETYLIGSPLFRYATGVNKLFHSSLIDAISLFRKTRIEFKFSLPLDNMQNNPPMFIRRKLKHFAIVSMAIIAGNSCSNHRNAEVVIYPFIHSSLYDFADITKVVLTDSATIVSYSSDFIPNYELDNDTDWKICSGGNEYKLKSCIGINPGEKIVLDDNGKIEFTVIYDPIPERTQTIDILSGSEGFVFWGVDLTGTAREIQDERLNYQEDLSGPMAFDERIGESSINVHLLNFKPGMKSEVTWCISGIVDSASGEMSFDENGEAAISFSQTGSAIYQVAFLMTQTDVNGIINPGESIDVYIDLNCFGHNIMKGRDNHPASDIHYISTSDRHQSFGQMIDLQCQFTDIFDMPDIADTAEISIAQSYIRKANNGELTKEDFQTIDGFKWKFLKNALCHIQNEVLERITTGPYETVNEWEGAEEWIKGIIQPYKGKVVMIDMWNTWCAPCRFSISNNEPLKNDILKSDDIIWIYIADESSPILEYQEAINKIRGIHYRLKKDLKNELSAYFNVDGIPFYVLVEKDGSIHGRPDLRDQGKYVQELLDRSK